MTDQLATLSLETQATMTFAQQHGLVVLVAVVIAVAVSWRWADL